MFSSVQERAFSQDGAPLFFPALNSHVGLSKLLSWQTVCSKHRASQSKMNALLRFFYGFWSGEPGPLGFIALIFVSSLQTPFLKAHESSNSCLGGLILIWIQLIESSLRPALSQFPSLPATLVKTFANFPRNQISAVWLPTSQRTAPPKQTDRTKL